MTLLDTASDTASQLAERGQDLFEQAPAAMDSLTDTVGDVAENAGDQVRRRPFPSALVLALLVAIVVVILWRRNSDSSERDRYGE